jgi:hypothetical protein
MTFQECGAIAQTTLVYETLDGVIMNVLHWRHKSLTSPLPSADFNALVETIPDYYASEVKSTVGAYVKLVKIIGRDLSEQAGMIYEYNVSSPIAGTATGQPLPNHCTIAIKLNTGIVGRSFRGRIFHPGLTEDQVGGDYVLEIPANAMVAAWNDFLNGVEVDTEFNPVVLSRYTGKALRPQGIGTVITHTSISDRIVDSQRRRLAGRGS